MLRRANWETEKDIMHRMWETILPSEWNKWRYAVVCKVQRDGVTVPADNYRRGATAFPFYKF